MSEIVTGLPIERDWLAGKLGAQGAQTLRRWAVPSLIDAHEAAAHRYDLADWTNETTYGTDRWHCLQSLLGAHVEREVPGAVVRRSTDEFGSPFVIEIHGGLLYPHRFGKYASDDIEGWKFDPDSWIQSQIAPGPANGQGVLEYPGIPAIPVSRVVILAWAGNRHDGLTRSLLGVPYLDATGRVFWRGRPEELEINLAANHVTRPDAPRHQLTLIRSVPPPPPPLSLSVNPVSIEEIFD